MSEPFLGEVKIIGFTFAPRNWTFCDGQLLPINSNQSLFSLLGTTYGGNGRTDFALPDLRSRVPIHAGQGPGLTNRPRGQRSGEESVSLTVAEMPGHRHTLNAHNAAGDQINPNGHSIAETAIFLETLYSNSTANQVSMKTGSAGVVQNAGVGAGHNNMQPFLTVGYIIALMGLFPSRN